MNDNKNFLYNMRYTGWGRLLSALIIIAISAGVGVASYLNFGAVAKGERLENYITNTLSRFVPDTGHPEMSMGNPSNFLDYNLEYAETKDGKEKEDGKSTKISNIDEDENLDKFFNNKDFAFFIKGEYKDNKLVFEENTLKDKNLTRNMEKIIKRLNENIEYSQKETYIAIDSEDYNQEELDKIEYEEGNKWVEYSYGGDDEIAGATIYEDVTKTSTLKNFQIGLTNANLNNNPFISFPIDNVVLFGVLPTGIIAALLFFIFDILSKYDYYKERPTIKFFRRIPVEIKFIIWGILFTVAIGVTTGFVDSFYGMSIGDGSRVYFIYYLLLFMVIGTAVFLIAGMRFTLLWIKEIYNEGFKNSVIINSITFRLYHVAKRLIIRIIEATKNKIEKTMVDVGTLGTLQIAGITAALATIAVIFSLILASRSVGLWLLLGIIAIVVTYKLIYSVVKNIKNINDSSSEIAKGNYDAKVNEDLPYFKNIAHNFNTIGDNLTKSVEEQVKAERMRTELITNVSHDLKTPLTSIINYAKILTDEESTQEEKDEYAKIIHEKALKLKILIEDLFQISKATSNNIEFDKEKIDFSALVLQGIGEWKDHFEEKGLDIIYNRPDYPLVLELDGNRTYRVLDNLMGNIYKYAQENTRVYIDLVEELDSIKFTIKNISAYELNISSDELLERFTRGDKSRTTDGSGLGLSIASSLVEGQGGKFDIEIDGDLFKVIIEF